MRAAAPAARPRNRARAGRPRRTPVRAAPGCRDQDVSWLAGSLERKARRSPLQYPRNGETRKLSIRHWGREGCLYMDLVASRHPVTAGCDTAVLRVPRGSSEEHTSELLSLMRISYAVFC